MALSAAFTMGCNTSCASWGRQPRWADDGKHRGIIITEPPRSRRVDWVKSPSGEITILTREGVKSFDSWMRTKDFRQLMPPLAPHPKVPFLPGGIPDVALLRKMTMMHEGMLRSTATGRTTGSSLFCTPSQETPLVIYED